MDTGTKILVGAAVVIGGVVVYKMATKPTPAQTIVRQSSSPSGGSVDGFINLATSAFNYFAKRDPAPLVTPGVRGTGGAWDSTKDILAPLAPGQTAYADSTEHDYLLS